MDLSELDRWLPAAKRQAIITQLTQRIGLTRVRAECFLRLWLYLLYKEQQTTAQQHKLPLQQLVRPSGEITCTLREAAELFYHDKDQGSDRAAGMMLNKLAALGLIKKRFDGNTTSIEIQPLPELLDTASQAPSELLLDDFDPRCDAIPVANLLATNYSWMNQNVEVIPFRIAKILRQWAAQYPAGMRVLRRSDNLHPVGFYVFYPTAPESDSTFFAAPGKGLHLSTLSATDPFAIAQVGDPDCVSVFVRSWMIDSDYTDAYQMRFLQDAQNTLRKMQTDFPNLCDLHTLVIHPSYEKLASALGFQKTTVNAAQASIYWMYLAVDRFLSLDVEAALASLKKSTTAQTHSYSGSHPG
ncbi:MAG TPA: hypothetical protein IGS53_12425 [Leptolyngbyaceae cyanobacterium M33_DOE_097]|uniref:Uncharacterized protein n=1 Tax=Oscillatoriales cyanobacterium SpSt-418 TaxID=2282169 RepID=A0A7C3KH59_9CYAN|nr:hypothetical protein [Leptolyngbyaceae cyanobacterium M33_DOE_097]